MVENKRANQAALESIKCKDGSQNEAEIKELLSKIRNSLKPSQDSIERMRQDMLEIEDNEAVKEYKFIT